MWPATAWDDRDWEGIRARGWTVMDRVRDKQLTLRQMKQDAQRRIAADEGHMYMMTPAVVERQYRDRLAAGWAGSFTVLAFLFAMPDEPTVDLLNRRGEYFDIRSGTTWDLFFPGYYRSTRPELERDVWGTRPVGDRYARDWYFNASDFDQLRRHLEAGTDGRWSYSGGSDLVLLNAYVPERGEPTIDWASAQSGTIRPPETLSGVIERISRDLEKGNEDPAYGVPEVTRSGAEVGADALSDATRDFLVQAMAGIATALGMKALGM